MKKIIVVGGIVALSIFAIFITGRKSPRNPVPISRHQVGISDNLMFTFTVDVDDRHKRYFIADLGDSLSIVGAVLDESDSTIEIRRLELEILR